MTQYLPTSALPLKYFQLIQEVKKKDLQLDFMTKYALKLLCKYALKLLCKCEPSAYFVYLSHTQETVAGNGPTNPVSL